MKRVVSAALFSLVCSTGAAAADLPLPSVTFTAEAKLCDVAEPQDECSTLAIFYTPTRWRVDQTDQSGRTVVIYDVSKKTATEISFGEKTYAVSKFDPKTDEINVGFLPGPGIGAKVGEETVAGVPTTKYRVARTQDTLRSEGFAWVNANNIVMRLEVKITDSSSKSSFAFKMEVTKLAVGAFDPALLEVAIPGDFKKEEN